MRCTSSGVLFEAVYVASHAVISCQPHACISQPILNASPDQKLLNPDSGKVELRGRYKVTNILNLSEIPDEPYNRCAKAEHVTLGTHLYKFMVYDRSYDPSILKVNLCSVWP